MYVDMLVQDRHSGYIVPQYGLLGWLKRAAQLQCRQAESDQMTGYDVSSSGMMRLKVRLGSFEATERPEWLWYDSK